jgi:hypothetical protein
VRLALNHHGRGSRYFVVTCEEVGLARPQRPAAGEVGRRAAAGQIRVGAHGAATQQSRHLTSVAHADVLVVVIEQDVQQLARLR